LGAFLFIRAPQWSTKDCFRILTLVAQVKAIDLILRGSIASTDSHVLRLPYFEFIEYKKSFVQVSAVWKLSIPTAIFKFVFLNNWLSPLNVLLWSKCYKDSLSRKIFRKCLICDNLWTDFWLFKPDLSMILSEMIMESFRQIDIDSTSKSSNSTTKSSNSIQHQFHCHFSLSSKTLTDCEGLKVPRRSSTPSRSVLPQNSE